MSQTKAFLNYLSQDMEPSAEIETNFLWSSKSAIKGTLRISPFSITEL